MKKNSSLILLALFLSATPAYAACEKNESDKEVTACLKQDLRDADKRINAVYKELMNSLSDTGKTDLRNEQRAWLKQRDKTCRLDSKESDREKWLSAILANPQQTICVVRYTYSRVAELDEMVKKSILAALNLFPAAPASPIFAPNKPVSASNPGLVFVDEGYKALSQIRHRRGKHYYEVWLDRGSMAQLGDLLLGVGYSCGNSFALMVPVRRSQSAAQPFAIGMAIDLDDGFIYSRANGVWKHSPGSSGGVQVKLGKEYCAFIESSSELSQLFDRGFVRINLGDKPFEYTLPEGYRPYKEQ